MEKTTQQKTPKQNPLYQQRNEDIRHRCVVLGQSATDIAAAWGMEELTIRVLCRRLGIKLAQNTTSESRAKRDHTLMTPLSPVHQKIGVKLDVHRNLIAKQRPVEFAQEMHMTVMRLRKMELGAWDFSLSELVKIADILGLPVEDLIRPANPPCWEQPKATRRPSAH